MEVPVELSVMYDQLLRHDAELATPPAGLLNHQEMLGSLKKKDPQNDFSRDKNCLVDFLMSDSRREDVNIFVNIIWYNFFLLVEMHLSDNSDEFVLNI